jgi:hypothetical protein
MSSLAQLRLYEFARTDLDDQQVSAYILGVEYQSREQTCQTRFTHLKYHVFRRLETASNAFKTEA